MYLGLTHPGPVSRLRVPDIHDEGSPEDISSWAVEKCGVGFSSVGSAGSQLG